MTASSNTPDGRKIRVYSGTTIENYRTCAFVGENNQVVFDKSREPRHAHPRFYFAERFATAVTFGCHCATGRIPEHTLLIMNGRVPADLGYSSLDMGELFLVDKIYMPRPNVNVQKLDTVFDEGLTKHFKKLSPEELLS